MHRHDPPAAPEPIVQAPEIHGADRVLAERGGAHDARLHGDVEVCLREDAGGVLGHDLGEGDEFGVPGSLRSSVVGQ